MNMTKSPDPIRPTLCPQLNSMYSSSVDNELESILERIRLKSSQTRVFSPEGTCAKSHGVLYCQMLRDGQVPSAARRQTTRQKRGDADKPRSHIHRQLTKDLTQARDVNAHQTYAEQKSHICKLGDQGDFSGIHTGEKPRDKSDKSHRQEESLSRSADLNSHQRPSASEEKPHPCPHCGKSFRVVSQWKKHQIVHTGEKAFHCKRCDKRFGTLERLNTHQRVHTGEKPFLCEQCGKSFSQLYHMRNHQRCHTGEKPHVCQRCDKRFGSLGSLKTHQRIHTGVKPYLCAQCGRSFNQSSDLKNHQRTHTGEKPYACELCDKSFTVRCGLRAHRRVHTGEKPHACGECGKRFGHLGSLQTHRRLHTGERPYYCKRCRKSFNELTRMKRHRCVDAATLSIDV